MKNALLTLIIGVAFLITPQIGKACEDGESSAHKPAPGYAKASKYFKADRTVASEKKAKHPKKKHPKKKKPQA